MSESPATHEHEVVHAHQGHAVGGFGATKPADAEITALYNSDEIKAGLASHLKIEVSSVEVKEYKSQVVAGANYNALVVIGGAEYTAKVHRPLPHTGAPAHVVHAVAGAHL